VLGTVGHGDMARVDVGAQGRGSMSVPRATFESLERAPGTRNVSRQLRSDANPTVGPDSVGERLMLPAMCCSASLLTSTRFWYQRVAWTTIVSLA
jgi:hypothetical protein